MKSEFTIVLNEDKKSITIEGKVYVFDEQMQSVHIIIDEMFTDISDPVKAFEYEILQLFSNKQAITFYTLCGNSSTIMLSSLTRALEIDKEAIKLVLGLGEKYGIFSRGYNCTWKVNTKILKDRMISKAQVLSEIGDNELKIPDFTTMRKQAYQDIHGGGGSHKSIEEETVEEIVKKPIQEPMKKVVKRTLQEVQKELSIWLERSKDIKNWPNAVDKVNELKSEINKLQMQHSPLVAHSTIKETIPLRKKPALPLTPVPLKKPHKLVKT